MKINSIDLTKQDEIDRYINDLELEAMQRNRGTAIEISAFSLIIGALLWVGVVDFAFIAGKMLYWAWRIVK